MKYYCSVDIGGTKTSMGILDESGKIISTKMSLTPTKERWETILDTIAENLLSFLKESGLTEKDIHGVGIGCPGTFDTERENIVFAPNLRWENIPIKKHLEKMLSFPIFLENDTNLSTLGIAYYGEGKNYENVVGLFLGTGIGGGIVINKKLFIGSSGGAGELGHIVIDRSGPLCGCGNNGCIEAFASTTAIHNAIKKELTSNNETERLSVFTKEENRTKAIKDAMEAKVPEAETVIAEAIQVLGISISSMVNTLNPDIVVIGGGLMSVLGEFITTSLKETVNNYSMPGTFENLVITGSTLGENVALYGGAALVQQKLGL